MYAGRRCSVHGTNPICHPQKEARNNASIAEQQNFLRNSMYYFPFVEYTYKRMLESGAVHQEEETPEGCVPGDAARAAIITE